MNSTHDIKNLGNKSKQANAMQVNKNLPYTLEFSRGLIFAVFGDRKPSA